MIKEKAYSGLPYQFGNICAVYPGMMVEMLKMGSDVYSQRLNLLLLTQDDIYKILQEKKIDTKSIPSIEPLKYLMKSAEKDDSFLLELEAAFSTFIKEDIMLLPRINAVLVGPATDKRLITDKNFEDFQTILRIQNRRPIEEPPPEDETEFERKIRLSNKLVEELKSKQGKANGKGQTLIDLLEIGEVFGIDFKTKSIYAFYGLIQRFQRKEKWDQDIRMLCAGADSTKIKSEYWGLGSET